MTGKKQHTPGPWNVSDVFNVPVGPGDIPEKAPSAWIDRAHDGIGITFCAHLPRERILADQRLIASAPEMLEALDELVAEFDADVEEYESQQGSGYVPDTFGIELARAAIAKATGK